VSSNRRHKIGKKITSFQAENEIGTKQYGLEYIEEDQRKQWTLNTKLMALHCDSIYYYYQNYHRQSEIDWGNEKESEGMQQVFIESH
jgi:hypothetical protein